MPVAKKPPRKPPAAKQAAPALPDIAAMEAYFEAIDDESLDDALEKAQELLAEAGPRGSSRSRVSLARKALALCPLCADAWGLLAAEAATPAEARDLYERALAAAEIELGAESFEENAGRFWLAFETRPYMRARRGLALTLLKLGEEEAAMEHFRAMLKLNPGDNQGIRYPMLAGLMRSDDIPGAKTLLGEYPEDRGACWAYTGLLVAFREGQAPTPATMKLLKDARSVNARVADLIAGAEPPEPTEGGLFTVGGADEAADYAREFGAAWRKAPGASEWLTSAMSGLGEA